MPITTADIRFRLSATTGPGGTVVGTPGASLGGFASTTVIADGAVDNLFGDVTGAENAASNVDYACVFVHNAHPSLSLTSTVVYLSAVVGGGVAKAIAVDNVAATTLGSASAQSAVIATKNSAPSPVGSFSAPTTAGAGLALGTLGPGQVRAVWVRRTAANTAAVVNDGCSLTVQGNTT